jgi:hypothetical protein
VAGKEKRSKLIGLGLDNQDGHVRITKAQVSELYGGSEETHAKMQESCIKFSEKLDRQGKRLEDLPSDQLHDLAQQCELTPLVELRQVKKPKANN